MRTRFGYLCVSAAYTQLGQFVRLYHDDFQERQHFCWCMGVHTLGLLSFHTFRHDFSSDVERGFSDVCVNLRRIYVWFWCYGSDVDWRTVGQLCRLRINVSLRLYKVVHSRVNGSSSIKCSSLVSRLPKPPFFWFRSILALRAFVTPIEGSFRHC